MKPCNGLEGLKKGLDWFFGVLMSLEMVLIHDYVLQDAAIFFCSTEVEFCFFLLWGFSIVGGVLLWTKCDRILWYDYTASHNWLVISVVDSDHAEKLDGWFSDERWRYKLFLHFCFQIHQVVQIFEIVEVFGSLREVNGPDRILLVLQAFKQFLLPIIFDVLSNLLFLFLRKLFNLNSFFNPLIKSLFHFLFHFVQNWRRQIRFDHTVLWNRFSLFNDLIILLSIFIHPLDSLLMFLK